MTEPDQREQKEAAEHDRIVAADDRFVREQAQPVEREQGLDQERAAEERADEGRRESRS